MRIMEYDIVAKRITNYKFDSYIGATVSSWFIIIIFDLANNSSLFL